MSCNTSIYYSETCTGTTVEEEILVYSGGTYVTSSYTYNIASGTTFTYYCDDMELVRIEIGTNSYIYELDMKSISNDDANYIIKAMPCGIVVNINCGYIIRNNGVFHDRMVACK